MKSVIGLLKKIAVTTEMWSSRNTTAERPENIVMSRVCD